MSMYCFGDGKVEDDWGVETFLADRYALALVGGNEMVMTSRKHSCKEFKTLAGKF
jgi:hypothetical protein